MFAASLSFGSGEATLFKRDGGNDTVVASRQDLHDTLDPTAWNRLALRVKGGEAWLLVNDEPYLYASDVIDQVGGVGLELIREGSTVDEEEIVTVFRDLTLSSLADADPARAPTHTSP
jgi:hypothetical protein